MREKSAKRSSAKFLADFSFGWITNLLDEECMDEKASHARIAADSAEKRFAANVTDM